MKSFARHRFRRWPGAVARHDSRIDFVAGMDGV
jgi:hypothetical protein